MGSSVEGLREGEARGMNAELIRTEVREEELPREDMGRLQVERGGGGVGERTLWGWKGNDRWAVKEGAETGSRTEEG